MLLGWSGTAHAACADLARLPLPGVTIETAQVADAAPFTDATMPLAPPVTLPAHCRVTGTIRPTGDSAIGFEMWLPVTGWNSRMQGIGNGGFGGGITYRGGMVEALRRGYAAIATDTGHRGGASDSGWARGHPEKVVDFGYRAIHLAAVNGKALLTAFYGRPADRTYFIGCSNGGRQALMEAQRYPQDYDGIIAGAPAYDWTAIVAARGWNIQALRASPASAIPAAKTPAIAAAVLHACDRLDGMADGVLDDPRHCRFDPASLACRDGDRISCLTAPQQAALRRIYAGPPTLKKRKPYWGWLPGGEVGALPGSGWDGWLFVDPQRGDERGGLFTGFMRDFVKDDPSYDYRRFDVTRDAPMLARRFGPILNATDPDLRPFFSRGGKLILFHGWSDPVISPLGTIAYRDAVRRTAGTRASDAAMRLFVVPGLQHCFGGTGLNGFGGLTVPPADDDADHNMSAALERWVEKGVTPDSIVAARYANLPVALFEPSLGTVVRTGRLCAYPLVARWDGKGDPKRAESFTCVAPNKGAGA